jgi:integrase
MDATTVRNVDRVEGRSTPHHRVETLRLGERVIALRERLEARADTRIAGQLRADVKEARGFVRGFDSRNVSDTTATRYDRVVRQMREADQRPEDAGCRSTFEFRRAALVHVTRAEVKTALRDQDKYRRTGDVDRAADAYGRVRNGLDTLRRYPPTTGSREADLQRRSAYGGPARPDAERSNSKRGSMSGLPSDWRDSVQREARPDDRAALAAMALTGARPAEVRGIRVRADADSITLTVRGAKVDDARGVAVRTVSIDRADLAETEAGRDILGWLGEREQRTVAHSGNVEAFRERVSRAADRAGMPQVSAYTYRHATARDLRAEGLPRAEIAERLGHRSDRSQSTYG